MSITPEGVKFEKSKNKKGIALLVLVTILEGVFSFFLYLAIAGKIFSPDPTEAAPGVPRLMSYQGRLTDASGNPLGGAGTVYCFRYSIYDAVSGGSKVWPTGTPTDSTTTVTDGTFNDKIGRMDPINFDMFGTSTLYLNVDVNTVTSTCGGAWETLSPRQQITASGFALASESIYGDYISTVISTSTKIQIGAGGGVTSGQILLSLSVKNVADDLGTSCTDNGSLWYNSANSRALICENGTIQTISNSSTTISGISTNSGSLITGNLVFSNSNGVSFGQNGQTITASVNAGGGGATYSSTNIGNERGWAQASISMGQNSIYFTPHILQDAISAIAVKMPVMVTNSSIGSSSGNVGYTAKFAIYTKNATNETVLSIHYSTSWTLQVSNSSNVSRAASFITGFANSTSYNSATSSSAGLNLSSIIHGPREVIMPISSLLTAGQYWFAFANSSSLIGGTSNSVLAMSYIIASSQTVGKFGNATTATSGGGIAKDIGLGTYSVTSAAFPSGVTMSHINKAGTNPIYYIVNNTN